MYLIDSSYCNKILKIMHLKLVSEIARTEKMKIYIIYNSNEFKLKKLNMPI